MPKHLQSLPLYTMYSMYSNIYIYICVCAQVEFRKTESCTSTTYTSIGGAS